MDDRTDRLRPPDDTDTLPSLRAELTSLRERVRDNGRARLEGTRSKPPLGGFGPSAQNLAQYLALRRFELRPLQDRLAAFGLSSLGRIEGEVLSSLDRVLRLLDLATGNPPRAGSGEESPANCLEANSDVLFGDLPKERPARIMVTLPAEAAWNGELLHEFLEQGMDCARIDCGEDNAAVWQAMLENLRHAEARSGRRCRVLMDLGGHRIRTGPVQSAPAVRHIKVAKDPYGRVVGPARLLLVREGTAESALPEGIDFRLTLPAALYDGIGAGDRLRFTDVRSKERQLDIVEGSAAAGWLAQCDRGAYLSAETRLAWQQRGADGDYREAGEFSPLPFAGDPYQIRLFEDDHLLLTRDMQPGHPAEYNENGNLLAPARIGCSHPGIIEALQLDDPVWFDDGKLGALVESLSGNGAMLRVTHAPPKGLRLRAGRPISFPRTRRVLPPLSDQDLSDLDFICRHADLVGCAFVESADDMGLLLRELEARDGDTLPVVVRIETDRGVRNLPELLLAGLGRHPLGVMVARGDLAVDLGSLRVAEIQEEILWLCEAAHVPVIWAAESLERAARKGVQEARPQLADAAMGLRAECVMLDRGRYAADAVHALSNLLIRMQDHQRKRPIRLRALHW